MRYAIRWLFWQFTRLLLSLRYRVRIVGRETLQGLTTRSKVLVMPNHPAYVDPMIILSQIGGQLDLRPLVYEGTYDNWLVWPFMKLIHALKVPDMESASSSARELAASSVQAIVDGLKAGDNHIFWPSGRLQRRGLEILGGARAAADVLEAVPDCQVILIRTRGLWGSMFGFAPTGKLPPLTSTTLYGLWVIVSNLLFLTPRRDVTITIERVDRSELPPLERTQVNAFLERRLNAEGQEPPTFVPYHFLFGRRELEYPELASPPEVDLTKVKPEVKAEVVAMLSDKLKRPLSEGEQRADTTLDLLGFDSIDRMELSLHLEQRFGFSTDQVPGTLGQCWALAAGLLDRAPPRPAPPEWFSGASPDEPKVLADTIAEAFLRRAAASRNHVAVAEDEAGCVTYGRLLAGAVLVRHWVGGIPAPNIGLMLPAAVAGDMAFLGLHLAGKLPVILNWTTGPTNLAHAATTMGLTHVITSRRFLDRSGITIPGVEFLCMEDMQKAAGRFAALRAWLASKGLAGVGLPHPDPDGPAVVLFTSGSEKAPKAVPLTHRNLLTNVRSGLDAMGLRAGDAFLGFLPTFHSFGLSVTTLAPLLAGLRVVRHPDPTDAAGLARKVGLYKVTVLAGTPTFLTHILGRAKADQMASLRLLLTGAEKCPQALFDRCKELAPGALLLEGYGITECSPVVAMNTPAAHRPGTVGKALPVVKTRVLDVETKKELGIGATGMLLVSGPTIFPGYLAYDGESPFQNHDGEQWYVTGDLVQIDEEGFIRFMGRLKRFVKAGGEMVSLPALEDPLAARYPATEQGPRVAVEGVELAGGGRRIVLFTTEEVSLRDANAVLWDAGMRGVMRLDEVRRLDAVPLLGTGKTDYKALRAMVEQGGGRG